MLRTNSDLQQTCGRFTVQHEVCLSHAVPGMALVFMNQMASKMHSMQGGVRVLNALPVRCDVEEVMEVAERALCWLSEWP